MTTASFINFQTLVDMAIDISPFLLYGAVLCKVWQSWKKVKLNADPVRRNRMASILILFSVVVFCLLGANGYALLVTGKTYLSIRGFQLFMVANCVVYWLVLDILTKDSIPEEGRQRESTG